MNAVPDLPSPEVIARKRETYGYFLRLRDSRLVMDEFRHYWNSLAFDTYNSKQLTVILYSAARKIEFIGPDDYKELVDFLYHEKKLDLWSEQAKGALPFFNTRDLSQSLWSLAKISVIPSLSFVQDLKNRSLEMMQNFNAYDLTDILWSFSHLGIHPGSDFMKASNNRLNELMPNFTRIDYTKSIRSLTILSALQNNRIPSGLMKTLLKQEKKLAVDNILAMQFDMAGLWYDLPQYRKENLDTNDMPSRLKHILQSALKAENDNAASFGDPRAKIDFSFSNGNFPIFLQTDYAGKFVYDVEAQTPRYNGPTEFQNAVLRVLHPDAAMIRLRDPEGLVSTAQDVTSRLTSVFNQAAPGQYALDYAPEGELKIASLEKPHELAPAETKEAANPHKSKSSVIDYFMSLKSLETYDEFVSEFYPRWTTLQYLPLDIDELSTALSQMAYIFKRDETPLSLRQCFQKRGFFDPWYDKALRIGDFTPAFLCSSMNAFADLGIFPHKEFMTAWLDQAYDKMSDFSTNELVRLMRGHSMMGVLPPRPFLEKWTEIVASRLADFGPQELVRLSRTMAIFHVVTGGKDFLKVSEMFIGEADVIGGEATHISRNNQIRLLLGQDLAETRPTANHKSNWEELMGDEFARQGFPLVSDDDHYIPELNRKVDFLFEYQDRKVILESDGPGHLVWCDMTGDVQFNGSTQLQTALLGKIFPDDVVIRLNYLDVKDFKSDHGIPYLDNTSLVEMLGREFPSVGPGTYQSCYIDGRIGLKPMFRYAQKDLTKMPETHRDQSGPQDLAPN